MRQRGTIFIVLFILIAAGIIGVSRFLGAQPPHEYTIAVDPLAQAWAEGAVNAFNASQPSINAQRIQFRVSAADDLSVWQGQATWTTNRHQDAWLPASNVSVTYARAAGLPLSAAAESLARTPLVWGGYTSRTDLLTSTDTIPLDWAQVQGAAQKMQSSDWRALGGQQSWGYLKLGFGQVDTKISGVAALFIAAAAYNQNPDLTQVALSQQQFRSWLLPIVKSRPSFFQQGDVASAMTRGPSTIEMALLPEAQWLINIKGMNAQEPIRLNYPAYQFVLDFPLVAWQDTTPENAERQEAVRLLANWLQTAAQQSNLPAYGLRPATTEPTEAHDLFKLAIQYGIQFTPDYGQAVTPPTLNDLRGLTQYVTSNR
ncbi:MAG: substrate-binding domain-containing protein [Chloroflexi bacterium]|nr:substrate-binding domain-containing protein [Chloroflexota bacterium]MCC6896102.1 substrate-binding domain-containing protein [Anaerolineae bacterium]